MKLPSLISREATPDIEPETKQELSDGRGQDATQNCYAPDQQNVGNLSDYTFDRLNIETPSLSPSESAIIHGHQEPPIWAKVRDRIIENDQLNLAAKYCTGTV